MGKIIIKHLKKYFFAALFSPLLFGGVVWAASSTHSSNGLVTPKDPSISTTLPDRIAARKNSSAIALTEARRQLIIKNCLLAQEGLQQIKTKDVPPAKTRGDTYDQLATKLATTIDHLERQEIDTAGIKEAQSSFTKAINQYLSDSISYKTAMDDVVIMDCAKDPLGFEVTLTSARQLRDKLSKDSKAIKATLPNLTKEINAVKQALLSQNSDNGGSN